MQPTLCIVRIYVITTTSICKRSFTSLPSAYAFRSLLLLLLNRIRMTCVLLLLFFCCTRINCCVMHQFVFFFSLVLLNRRLKAEYMSARVRPSEGTGSTLAEWQSRRRRRRRIIISKCFQTLTNSPLSACIPQTAEKATLDTHTPFLLSSFLQNK